MANPFNGPVTNSFITTVLYPAGNEASGEVRNSAEPKARNVLGPTGRKLLGIPETKGRATVGEWVPDDFAKIQALYKVQRGQSSTAPINNDERRRLQDQAAAVAQGKAAPPPVADKIFSEDPNDNRTITFEEIVRQAGVPKTRGQRFDDSDLTDEQIDRMLKNPKFTQFINSQRKETERRDSIKNTGRFTQVDRLPFVLTCQQWINDLQGVVQGSDAPVMSDAQNSIFFNNLVEGANVFSKELKPRVDDERYIYCNVNPSQVSWSFPLRAVDQQTMAGRVQHVWRNPVAGRDGYFDEPIIRFTFQSGNIMPIRVSGQTGQAIADVKPQIPAGLSNFYNFFELYNQPRIIGSGGNRDVNYMYIYYNSRAFPSMMLKGMWSQEGITFEESADNPNQITWSASFICYDSMPKFGAADTMLNSFVNAGFGGTRTSDADFLK